MNDFDKEKYYIPSKLDRYIKYKSKTNKEMSEIISEVNCNCDYDYYKLNLKSNYKLNELILVNKYYYLDKDYIPNDLVKINSKYSLKGYLRKRANKAFEKMCKKALKENIYLINTSPYRSYERQNYLYNEVYKEKKELADNTIARPGYSEHQTGYAVDIRSIEKDIDDFYDTKEYYWLINNSYKYGFILRYPKDKEKLTGYAFEPWHFRYVGNKVAKYIYKNNITFDEYYAYFIEKRI